MPLHLNTLKTRALTAVVFVAVMLGGILYHSISFRILLLIIQIGCAAEYISLIRIIDPNYKKFPFPFIRYFFIGFLYIIAPANLLFSLYEKSEQFFSGPLWVTPMLIIASIWINDTMAYLVGSLIGKTPLSKISPKKTIEGTVGGIILAVLVISYGAHAIWQLPLQPLIIISLTAAIFGTLGDLLESKLKRMAGVKDSGSIMPGHGGFLDRFDSLLVATPAVWIALYLFY